MCVYTLIIMSVCSLYMNVCTCLYLYICILHIYVFVNLYARI